MQSKFERYQSGSVYCDAAKPVITQMFIVSYINSFMDFHQRRSTKFNYHWLL